MIGESAPPPSSRLPAALSERIRWYASIVFCGVLPAFALIVFYETMTDPRTLAVDFRAFYDAAGAILDGESPYADVDGSLLAASGAYKYAYPPLTAIATIPLRVAPFEVAGVGVFVLLTLMAVAIPFVLGVRDWRCFGVVFLWPPVWSAIQTGNVTLPLALAAALSWRYRDLRFASSVAVGTSLAAKMFLWPLLVWLAASRRGVTAALAIVVGVGVTLATWAPLGFAGLRDYPHLIRRLEGEVGGSSLTLHVLGLEGGLPESVARVLWLGLGICVLAAVLFAARRGQDRSAFVLAIAASLALSPIVWLHYFAMLLVVVALAQPRLGLLWFLPIALVVTPGSTAPTALEAAATLAVAAVVVGFAIRLTWSTSANGTREGVAAGHASPGSAARV